MKTRLFLVALSILMLVAFIPSCSFTNKTAEGTLSVGTIKGPTGMGMAKVISDNKDSNKYVFDISNDASEISSKLLGKQLDIAAVPVNLAAVINKKTEGAYLIAAINTLGVLYVIENGSSINSIYDLAGKTVHAYGQNATPEYIINYILEKNGIKDQVTFEWYSDPASLSALAAQNKVDVVMLPEPQVTAAITTAKNVGNTELRTVLDLSAEWSKVSSEQLVQGCIVVKKQTAQKYPDAVSAFLDEYKASVNFVNESIDDAAKIIEEIGIIPKAAIAKQAIPRCNIVFVEGDDMIRSLKSMYGVLFSADPKSVGGALPGDDIYYKR